MRSFFSCVLIVLLSFGLVVNEASAKRFGGGRSFGIQRSHSSLFSSHSAKPVKSLGQRSSNRWGGLLGGMLIGGLLTSLFMGHGLGTGLLTWIVLGALIFFVVNLVRRKMQPGFQSASHTNSWSKNPFNFNQANMGGSANPQSRQMDDFDAENFLRDAKVKFIRLQTAYDQKNLRDLSEFTAPEVFAEIKMQLEELGNEPNITEVINLDARLLDVTVQADSKIASVQFIGTIKENGQTSPLDEIWHFRQFFNSNNWVVGGIQQEGPDPRFS